MQETYGSVARKRDGPVTLKGDNHNAQEDDSSITLRGVNLNICAQNGCGSITHWLAGDLRLRRAEEAWL